MLSDQTLVIYCIERTERRRKCDSFSFILKEFIRLNMSECVCWLGYMPPHLDLINGVTHIPDSALQNELAKEPPMHERTTGTAERNMISP